MTKVTPNKFKGLAEESFRFLPLILAVILWCFLTFKEQFFLKKIEDLSVFLFDKLFILEGMKIPGGFLGLAGSFFTQFLHLPWLGALIWVFMLLVSYQLTIRVFSIPEGYRPLAIIPVALLIIGNMSLGYGVFLMRTQDHFFAPLLGYLTTLAPLAVMKRMNVLWSKLLFLFIWITIGFVLFGTFAFVGAFAAACATLVRSDIAINERITVFASAIAFIILIPLVIFSAYTSYRLADSWILGLPSISDDSWTQAMRTPFILSLLCPILLGLTTNWLSSKKTSVSKLNIIRLATYIIAISSVCFFWFKDDNFHTELAMSNAVDRFDWNRTVEIYKDAVQAHAKSDAKAYSSRTRKIASAHNSDEVDDIIEQYKNRFFEPTRSMILYRDLALLKTNRALDEAFTMKNGSRLQKSRTQIPMAWQSGKQLYFQYGLVNMCYRWCLEDEIEHFWNFGTLRYMAMHSVIMQEPELAEKYINKLSKTIFYRKWAKAQRVLKSDSVAMSSTEPYKSILPYMCFENQMSNDMIKTEAYLINHFLDTEPENATPEYDRAALLFAMHIQDIPRFWERLYYYVNSNDFEELPVPVQEAALLYSTLQKRTIQVPFNDKVKESYDTFNRFVQSHPIRNMKESDYVYRQKFGKTFYYFYYFVRDLKTY